MKIASDFHGTINAAFLLDVKESNPELWALLRTLRQVALQREVAREAPHRFVEMLAKLRDDLALQFSLEETYGFVGGIANSSSHGKIPREAAVTRNQHRELYLQLHDICEEAEEAQYRGTITRDLLTYVNAFEEFDTALRAHEQFEADLIRSSLGSQAF